MIVLDKSGLGRSQKITHFIQITILSLDPHFIQITHFIRKHDPKRGMLP